MDYLFRDRNKLKEKLEGKFIFLFLDYDGTLAPIAETPDKAIIPIRDRELLHKLSMSPNCRVAIISGRSLSNVKSMLGPRRDIIYVGNHGLEIEGPKTKFRNPLSPSYKGILERLKGELAHKLSVIKGVILEDKGLSLSLHYRKAKKADIAKIKTILAEATILYAVRNKIKIKTGKMVFEIRPAVEWDKGKAVLWLMARQKFSLEDSAVFPIYIGDDVTDEDAFRALKEQGMTVFVGKPQATGAGYYLKDTGEVLEFLRLILKRDTGYVRAKKG